MSSHAKSTLIVLLSLTSVHGKYLLCIVIFKLEKKIPRGKIKEVVEKKYERAILLTCLINSLFSFAQLSLNLNSMVENNEVIETILFTSLFLITIFKSNSR